MGGLLAKDLAVRSSSLAVSDQLQACPWAKGEDYLHYHDTEWGKPCHDRQKLFEKLCLEGQQAGLSWITILRKRAHYRQCFYQFDPEQIATMTDAQLLTLLNDKGLVRNRLKVFSIRHNAQALLAMEEKGINFPDFVWQFVGGNKPIINVPAAMADIPTQTERSQAMSKALKQHGFSFVGPVICYAYMQSMGLVCDHLVSCPQHPQHFQ